ncbi:methylenetetrahydrofolate reductase (NADPH) [Anopheles ziemanni]|uniref:methylenetetrahydrofolate reductase (NADPH) n=1 Tax=Anopheles coustani TaxID=139045 RepID=UPI00265A4984|nr:methylenetetrahydrofolate reductase (NADPH) [Anopheles coustani]XP_058178787.1 methylenetetrahydrofolate reductase (NADPH) [Anopheles ziemanni]
MASLTPANEAEEQVENLHTKLATIFGSPSETVSSVCYSIEISAKDDFDMELLEQLSPQPIFCSFPWISDETLRYEDNFPQAPSLRLSKELQKARYTVVNHLSCYNLTEQQVEKFLATGVRNLFIIRGDTVTPGQRFRNAANLVQHLRDREQANGGGVKLTIGVGGYPYGHSQSRSDTEELQYLQAKVAIGVDFLLTQTLYDADSFFRYRERCRQVGITIPIIPGIYVPHSYQHLQAMLKITNITLPPLLRASFDSHADDTPDQFEAFVVDHFVGVVRNLLQPNVATNEPVRLVHFFTFNKLRLLQQVLFKLKNIL